LLRPDRSREIRRFSRVARQRFDDAQLLLNGERNTGAVYLAGYVVECGLKALLLSAVSASECIEVLDSFRGNDGHNLDSLKAKYLKRQPASFPKAILGHLTLINNWTTSLRYMPANESPNEARRFLASTEVILRWIEGRI
jgi:HEPN domain-containing protein